MHKPKEVISVGGDDHSAAEIALWKTVRAGVGQSALGAGLRQVGPTLHPIEMREWDFLGDYHPEDLVVTVGAAMRWSSLNKRLATQRQWVPQVAIDGQDDTVGGAVASGVTSWFQAAYGPLRDRVLGVRLVTPAFGPVFIGSKVVKSVAGYNLVRLVCGTRGGLGLLTEVTLKVNPRPERQVVWTAAISHPKPDRARESLSSVPCTAHAIRREANGQWQDIRVYHGRVREVDRLQEQLGVGHPDLPAWEIPLDSPLVTGAVPATLLIPLLQRWPDRDAICGDLGCGTFLATVSEPERWPEMAAWIRSHQGGVQVLRDPDSRLPSTARPDPWWRSLKQAYDPDHCLQDWEA